MALEPRKAIKDGEWIITMELRVGGEPTGVSLSGLYADSYVAGGKSKKNGQPDDFGMLMSRRLYEAALEYQPLPKTRARQAKLRKDPISIEEVRRRAE